MAKAPTKDKKRALPPKFLAVDQRRGGYSSEIMGSASAANNLVDRSETRLNDRSYNSDQIGIYQLVKVVRRKSTPIEVEEISICSGVTGSTGSTGE
jgi:hypothetical protein